MSQDLWEEMEISQQVVLAFHKWLYTETLNIGHKDSYATRFLISTWFSQSFSKMELEEYKSILKAGHFPVKKYKAFEEESGGKIKLNLLPLDFWTLRSDGSERGGKSFINLAGNKEVSADGKLYPIEGMNGPVAFAGARMPLLIDKSLLGPDDPLILEVESEKELVLSWTLEASHKNNSESKLYQVDLNLQKGTNHFSMNLNQFRESRRGRMDWESEGPKNWSQIESLGPQFLYSRQKNLQVGEIFNFSMKIKEMSFLKGL